MKLENKKICITGGLGFIGSHFVELVSEKFINSFIHIIDTYSYCVSDKTVDYIRKIKNNGNKIKISYLDINNFFLDKQYDYIVNFAAESHVDNSIDSGLEFIDSNIIGAYHLLEQSNDKTRFVQISTDEVYGSESFCTEENPINPSSIYSASKASADLLALALYKTHKSNIVITRSCNNFGPRQFTEKFIPVALNSIFKGKDIPVYGNGGNKRQWIYVKDNCEQILAVMLYGQAGEVYNITPHGDSNVLSNNDLACMILELSGLQDKSKIKYVSDRKGHDLIYSMIGEKTRSLISASDFATSKYSFKECLKNTINWYYENQKWFDS